MITPPLRTGFIFASGLAFAAGLLAQAPQAPILMVSSLNSELKAPFDSAADARLPIFKFLDKPVSGKTLVDEIQKALASKKTAKK